MIYLQCCVALKANTALTRVEVARVYSAQPNLRSIMKLLIISGVAKGLGLALCNQYQKNGFTIVEFSRTAPHPFSVSIDLSSSVDSATVIATALAPLSAVQWQEIVIVNNAGTLNPIGPAAKKPRDAVVDNININFTSGLLFIIEALKQFQGHSGK